MSLYHCKYCSSNYAHSSSLSRHVRKQHRGNALGPVEMLTQYEKSSQTSEAGYICCITCDSRFPSIQELVTHITQAHETTVCEEKHEFSSFSDFVTWKENEEARTSTQYVQPCGSRVRCGIRTWYYYCNRSGKYRSTTKGIRNSKLQGSEKLGIYCTAHLTVSQYTGGNVLVNFCSTHYGHIPEEDIMHLRLPKDFKLNVTNKLLQGVTIDRILDDVKDSVDEGGLKRCHHSSKKDIQNMKRVCNVDGVQKHSNDPTSVAAWVEELKSMEFCPVIAFKAQGVSSEREGVKDEDFLLALQTQFQLEMMKAFGRNVICVDATHSTNQYEFLLVTVMVIDDFGEGIPVAWAITTREDTSMLTYFFQELRTKTGPLSTQVFMSDDAMQYWSAWTAAYSSINTTKLLCAWHVDRAWRKALKERIPVKENQIDVYHHLRSLLTEVEPDKFRGLLQQFVSFLSKCHPQFCSYFQRNYTPRVEEWATCYRVSKFVNTNMYLESFHRVLKIVYLQGKKNRRLDNLIHVLLKLARNKAFEQVQKIHKGKTSHRINEINRRHKESSKMISEGCHLQTISSNEWKITSQTTPGKKYIVQLENRSCPSSCKLRCVACDVCIHMYTCSCVDSVVHTTICKHIHATCFLENSTNATIANSATENETSEITTSTNDSSGTDSGQEALSLIRDPIHLSTILSNSGRQIDTLKKSAFDNLHQLHTLLTSSDNNDAVQSATEHIKSGI